MPACLDNSATHCIFLTSDSSKCHTTTNSLCRTISNLDLCCRKFNNLCKTTPQEPNEDQIWLEIRHEAQIDTTQEPILSKYYISTILSHKSLESALANHLSIKLSNTDISRESLYDVFLQVLHEDINIQNAVRDDLKAVKERDPACKTYVQCFLNFKGFLACQTHRIAHNLWLKDRTVLAYLIQSQVSQVFGVDIHPGARIGPGIVLDHGTGVVIGETAVIGKNVTILYNVTLGGTGKVEGDRHPKIGDGVMIGAGAKVLGNVKVGEMAKIGAGSIVLKDIPPRATAVGNPAKLVGLR